MFAVAYKYAEGSLIFAFDMYDTYAFTEGALFWYMDMWYELLFGNDNHTTVIPEGAIYVTGAGLQGEPSVSRDMGVGGVDVVPRLCYTEYIDIILV